MSSFLELEGSVIDKEGCSASARYSGDGSGVGGGVTERSSSCARDAPGSRSDDCLFCCCCELEASL